MASTIKIKNSTTTGSAPSSLSQGELAINVADGNLFYGDGSNVKQHFIVDELEVKGNLTAQQYIVSSSVIYTTQSFSSGSTAFGDSADDTHVFTGNITASGNISSSGTITMSSSSMGHVSMGHLVVSGPISASGFIKTDGNITGTNLLINAIELGHAGIADTTIARSSAGAITVEGTAVLLAGAQTGITSIFKEDLKIGEDAQTAIDFETANEIHFDANNAEVMNLSTLGINLIGDITASNNISASGTIIGNIGTFNDLGHITASGNISSSGTIKADILQSSALAVDAAVIGVLTTSGDADILGNIELGDQNDTTIARSAAGAITVEGVPVLLQGLDTLVGRLTASSDISSSGAIKANSLTANGLTITDDALIGDDLIVTGDLTCNNFSVAGVISHVGNTDTKITFGHSDSITFSSGGTDLLILSEGTTDTIALGAAISTHITASGNISASGTITANTLEVDQLVGHVDDANTGLYFASDTIVLKGNNESIATFATNRIEFTEPITASGDISSSGTITGNSIAGTLSTAAQTNITSVGTLGSLTVSGDITANGNIVGDDGTIISNINILKCDVVAADANDTTQLTISSPQISALVNDTDVFNVTETLFTHDTPVKFTSTIVGQRLPIKNLTGTSETLTAAESGKLCLFSDADGAIVTLPDSGDGSLVGVYYDFYISVAATSNVHRINVADTTNEDIEGYLHVIDADNATAQATAANRALNSDGFDAISMDGTTTGTIGTNFRITNIAADRWYVTGHLVATGTPSTPFVAS